MKALNIFLLALIFSFNHGYCNNNAENILLKAERANPGIFLNCQDVPIFYNENPLEGLNAFTVIPPLLVNNVELELKLEKAIENELKSLGEVIHLKDLDMRGFGAGNILNIQLKPVTDYQGKEMPFSRISLQVQTAITIMKTNLKTFPIVWSINSFFQGLPTKQAENQVVEATLTLTKEFVQNYKYANSEQKKKPVFYLYD